MFQMLRGTRTIRSDDGGIKHIWNVGQFLKDYRNISK